MHLKNFKAQSKTSRHDSATIQLAVRVPRALHEQFYHACKVRGMTGSVMLRTIMAQFVALASSSETERVRCDE